MTHVHEHAFHAERAVPQHDSDELFQLIKRADINTLEVDDLSRTVVEVSVLWKSAILHVAHLAPGQRFTLATAHHAAPDASKRVAPGLAVGAAALVAGAQGVPYAAAVGAALTAASLGAGAHAQMVAARGARDTTRFVVDHALLGADEAVVVRFDDDARFVFPSGARGEVELAGARRSLTELDASGLASPCADDPTRREITFVPDGRYRLDLGALSVVAKLVRAGRPIAGGVRPDPLLGRVALGTGLVMAALLGTLRLAVPEAGMLSSEDADVRMELLRSAVQRMEERAPPPTNSPATQQGAAAGRAHEGPNGAMGDRTVTGQGRTSIRRRQPAPSIARTRAEAARSGVLSVDLGVGATPAHGAAPSSPFGALIASGDAERDAHGRLDGASDGPGSGFDGLDGVGSGWGGGGDARDTIGAGTLGTLGRSVMCDDGSRCEHGMRGSLRHRGPSAGIPRPLPISVSAGISPEVIRRVVHRNLGQVNRCYEQGLSTNPRASGRVAVRFVIAPGGAVLGAAIASDSVGIASVSECIAGAVRRWSFPIPADSGAVTVTYPFSLIPADP